MTDIDPHEQAGAPREIVSITRRPNVDMYQTQHSRRSWGHLNGAFAFGTMLDWQGELVYRRQNLSLGRGDVCLLDPGEFFHAEPADESPGIFRVFEILPETFEALCRAEGYRAPIHFGIINRPAPLLVRALDALQSALVDDAESLEQQSRLGVLAHAAVTTCLEQGPRGSTKPVPLGPCERLRELLHGSEGPPINLCDFARSAGVSQFQLLRAFKRRYGLPPHAYGLQVRVERARLMLQQGFSVAEAAAASDFADQSHLTRHFRRIRGVTPAQYAAGSYVAAFRAR
ncbi:MAG TPA: AraC family transcriptional regulator [Polyangiaceae bacterium]